MAGGWRKVDQLMMIYFEGRINWGALVDGLDLGNKRQGDSDLSVLGALADRGDRWVAVPLTNGQDWVAGSNHWPGKDGVELRYSGE